MLRYYTPTALESFNRNFFNQIIENTNLNNPKTNIFEQENQITIEMAIPGFKKEQIEIKMENEKLTIKGNLEDKTEEGTKWISRQFQQKPFENSFSISRTMDTENIQAQFANGILSISIPKQDEFKAKTAKEILIS